MYVRVVMSNLLLLLMASVMGITAKAANPFHICVVTGTATWNEGDRQAAAALVKKYGDVKSGGMIQHIICSDDLLSQQDTYGNTIVALAADPLLKAIIVNQSVLGTAAAFKRIHEIRNDILCLAGEPDDDHMAIANTADMVVSRDFVPGSRVIVSAAKELGAKTLVFLAVPSIKNPEPLVRQSADYLKTCGVFGLKFASKAAPKGRTKAQQFLSENAPEWIKAYGPETCFFATVGSYADPLINQVANSGGIFVEADTPYPLKGYPGAIGLDLSAEQGDFAAIMKKVEAAVVEKGNVGQLGPFAPSYDFAVTAGLSEYAIRCANGQAVKNNLEDLLLACGNWTPGSKWHGRKHVDAVTGTSLRNMFLV